MIKWKDIRRSYRDKLAELESMSPYDLLEVPKEVSGRALKVAYTRKVKTYHPDANDPFMKDYVDEYMKLLNAAYEEIRSKKSDEH